MKILVLGASGMLGHKLVQKLSQRSEVFCTLHGPFDQVERFGLFKQALTFERIDVRQTLDLENVIKECQPEVVVSAVGVVKQSPTSKDVVRTLEINSIFPHRLATLGTRMGFRSIFISTDCVFSGHKGMYIESDMPDAADLYGQSKRWGEVDGSKCLTIRTSVIGPELFRGNGLLEWLISNRGKSVQGYVNAVFSGFPTLVFADIIGDIAERHNELSGVVHVSSDPINKFDLLNKINSTLSLGISIARSEDFKIDRSLNSTRYREATGFKPPKWDEMIAQMAADPTPYDKWQIRSN